MTIGWNPVDGVDPGVALKILQQVLATDPGFVGAIESEQIPAVKEVAATVPDGDSILLLGIGGSALGARALVDALVPETSQRLTILDNIDPDSVARTLHQLDLTRTTVLVISKSGGTAETAAQMLRVHQSLVAAGVDADQKIVAITDPQHGTLRELVSARGWRSLEVPPQVGGRFSVLTAVGWLPALLCGVDVDAVRRGALAALTDLRKAGQDHALVRWIDGWRHHHPQRSTVVLFPYRDRLRTFGDWFAQLWAESLGKRLDLSGREVWAGSTPMVARGVTDQHSLVQLFAEGPDDKQYLFLDASMEEEDPPIELHTAALHPQLQYLAEKSLGQLRCAELEGTMAALASAGRPVSKMHLQQLDGEHLGAMMLIWEVATLMAASCLEVNPFDQPGVEAGKAVAFAKMGRDGWQERGAAVTEGAEEAASAPSIPCS